MDSKDQRNNGLKRFLRSFVFASAGIKDTFRTERNFKIHCVISVAVIIISIIIPLSRIEWIIVLFLIGGTLALELINTALEKIVDLVTSDYHPLAKAAKDAAAGAVFIYAILAAIIGIIIFFPKIFL
ncbi:diacylglycerol kinase family protein [Metabacillus fastidiosus]|uniref:diacylglycerol kinase family protein n=1 Tax=Metabacillus fastidiosus TaxID=1458 RepID=UPI002DBC5541|nr:diacylglycerol kinase family protein [Metabacillus fastidiosus]MEC2076520.1 diacylglycerol kinase family protein [Metabacillus fastidiosus]